MYFDFFNYTFSAIISFVTAVFGMSYPLLIESIQRIDDRYHSRHIKSRFENSIIFNLFNIFLLSSVITAIIVPFLLAAAESNMLIRYTFISLQIALLLLLVVLTILLVKQIQLYNDPKRLMNYILQNATRKDLDAVIDIMNNASHWGYPDLFKQGMQWIIDLITEENVKNGRK